MEQKQTIMAKKVLKLWQYRHILLLLLVCAFFAAAGSGAGERWAAVFSEDAKKTVIVLDAGHGGVDPGKVGTAGTLEKDINLAVAAELKVLLEDSGMTVIMTRETDDGLYAADSSDKKREDMKNRVKVIAEAEPALAVSIHQNSFTSADCKGAQVFYYKDSETGRVLAETLQDSFLEVLSDGNTRQAKPNGEYYLLRKAPCTIVIAECGFLSNPEEETLLTTAEYRKKVAEALHRGILQYLEKMSDGERKQKW